MLTVCTRNQKADPPMPSTVDAENNGYSYGTLVEKKRRSPLMDIRFVERLELGRLPERLVDLGSSCFILAPGGGD